MSPRGRLACQLVVTALLLSAPRIAAAAAEEPRREAGAPAVHHARGVVKSFGPERRFVTIAHEAIPGYMLAMTMDFESGTEAEVHALSIGDRVTFAFAEADGGRRVLVSIVKE